jgi:hypothetical protein
VIALIYEHDCPKDTGDGGCPVNGQMERVRPETHGSYYEHVSPRCLYTTAELKLVQVIR